MATVKYTTPRGSEESSASPLGEGTPLSLPEPGGGDRAGLPHPPLDVLGHLRGDRFGVRTRQFHKQPSRGEVRHIAHQGADCSDGAAGRKLESIHPEPPAGKTVDERQLVKLGVEDAAFLAAVRESLKPGGLFIIYNISPAQSPAEDLTKPYLPIHRASRPLPTRDVFAR